MQKRISEVKLYPELNLAFLYFDNVALFSVLFEGEIAESHADEVTRSNTLANRVVHIELSRPISTVEIGRCTANMRKELKVGNGNKFDHICYIATGDQLAFRGIYVQNNKVVITENLYTVPESNIRKLRISKTGRAFSVTRQDDTLTEIDVAKLSLERHGVLSNLKQKVKGKLRSGHQIFKNLGLTGESIGNMFGRLLSNRLEFRPHDSDIEIDDTRGILYHLKIMKHESTDQTIVDIDVYDMVNDNNNLTKVMTIRDNELVKVITQRYRISRQTDWSTWHIVSISAVTAFDSSTADLVVYFSNGYLAYLSLEKELTNPLSHTMNSLYIDNRRPLDNWYCLEVQNHINTSSIARVRGSLSGQARFAQIQVGSRHF